MEACVPVTDLLLYVLHRVDLQIYGIPHDSLLIVNALLIFRALERSKVIASLTVESVDGIVFPVHLLWLRSAHVLREVRRRILVRYSVTILRDDIDEVLVVAWILCCHTLKCITRVARQFAAVELSIFISRAKREGYMLEVLYRSIDKRFTAGHRSSSSEVIGII